MDFPLSSIRVRSVGDTAHVNGVIQQWVKGHMGLVVLLYTRRSLSSMEVSGALLTATR